LISWFGAGLVGVGPYFGCVYCDVVVYLDVVCYYCVFDGAVVADGVVCYDGCVVVCGGVFPDYGVGSLLFILGATLF
jgi:hypothetical protein